MSSSWCTGDDSCKVAEHYPDKSFTGPHRGDSMTNTAGEAPLDATAFESLPGTETSVDLTDVGIPTVPEVRVELHDPVNHPTHYRSDARCSSCGMGIECIDVVRHLPFDRGNAIKYLWRAGAKGATVEDLKKAIWYIEDEIAQLEGRKNPNVHALAQQ